MAKNSDRPAMECQPLVQLRKRTRPGSDRLRCTYIEVPQAEETAAVLGSRPYWCWGFEHGFNEHGVAIGNHTVFTRDAPGGKGLIGMDLVRLGLERGRSAEHAVEIMTSLLQEYGQGGSGYADKEWPYNNSFLIADRTGAVALETSDRHWALRRVRDVASLSNHVTIGTGWDALSDGLIEHAVAQGWWNADGDGRFDFAAAYRDSNSVPDEVSSGRHRRTCSILAEAKGSLAPAALRAALRDHYGEPFPAKDKTPADAEYFSVCMHAEPVGTTTASMLVHLPPEDGPATYWASLGSPCVGAFLPLYIDADVPSDYAVGGMEPSVDSPWWECKELLQLVERDWQSAMPRVRAVLDPFEAEVAEQAPAMASRPATEKTAFMRANLDAFRTHVRELRRALTG
jgi:dipeptidase